MNGVSIVDAATPPAPVPILPTPEAAPHIFCLMMARICVSSDPGGTAFFATVQEYHEA